MLLSTGRLFGSVGGGGGGGSDPYFANVVLLLGFEGTDGATSTTDESPSAHSSITFNGNAQIDTAQSAVSSTASCLFDGSGDYLSLADSTDWDLSDANSDLYTIEFWYRPHANVSHQYVMGQGTTVGDTAFFFDSTCSGGSAYMQFNTSADGSNFTSVGTGTLNMAIDTWHFIAVSKNASGKIRIWRNGTLDASATPANSAMFNSAQPLTIGRAFATAILNGWLDEIRITKGVCRYDTDGSITVPTAAFPRS